MEKAGKVLWKANSSRSDWRNGAILQRLVGAVSELNLIGQATRVEPVSKGSENLLKTVGGAELADAMLEHAMTLGKAAEFTVSGSDPAPWEIFWNTYPFDKEEGWVDGLNTLWFTFSRTQIPTRTESDNLLNAFFSVHQPEDTEYAVLHPFQHWSDFSDLHYRIPVTINLMFRGVFWANFLGRGHIEEFDSARLNALNSFKARWVGKDGLFVIASSDLSMADAPNSEPTLLSLTQSFRDALLLNSRWRLK